MGCITQVEPGWFRTVRSSTEAYACADKSACPGGSFYGFPDSCGQQYTGIRCGACRRGYGRSWGGKCIKCQGTGPTGQRIALFLIISTILVPVLIWLLCSQTGLNMINASLETAGGSHAIVDAVVSSRRLSKLDHSRFRRNFVALEKQTIDPVGRGH